MKKIKSIIALIIISLFLSFPIAAQMMAPEDPGGEPSGGDDPIGGGAPISGGTLILLGMAAIYGGKKAYELKKEK